MVKNNKSKELTCKSVWNSYVTLLQRFQWQGWQEPNAEAELKSVKLTLGAEPAAENG